MIRPVRVETLRNQLGHQGEPLGTGVPLEAFEIHAAHRTWPY